jgi:hypothetical protein
MIPEMRRKLGVALGVLCAAAMLSYAQERPPEEAQPPVQPQDPPALPPPPEVPSGQEAEPEAVVVLKGGQRMTGFLVEETPERIVLRIAGIKTPLKRKEVDRVEVLPPVQERYRKMRGLIDDSDVDGLLRLANWLRERAQWDSALAEIDQALSVKPDYPDAVQLRLLVQSQKELAERPRVGRPAQGAPEDQNDAPGTFPLLSDKEINTIKVFEIDLKDPPRITIPRAAVDQMLQNYKGHPLLPRTPEEQAMLYRASPTKVLDMMYRLKARELYPQVQVIDQPRAMRMFRDNVHSTWLMNSCATARCHGGEESGRLRLFSKRINTDPTVYTNFVILERYRLADGTPLINYDEPALSPLLLMGLPREQLPADQLHRAHPVVPAAEGRGDLWKPFFRNADDMRYQQAVAWIKAMYRPRPEYPIEYRPPTPEAIAPAANEVPVER